MQSSQLRKKHLLNSFKGIYSVHKTQHRTAEYSIIIAWNIILLLAFEHHSLHNDHFKSHQNIRNLLLLPIIREGVEIFRIFWVLLELVLKKQSLLKHLQYA